ncbi:MAG: ABC transporter permease [Candidatus Eutrophobiaceae bacterium]
MNSTVRIAFLTIIHKEIKRLLRIWIQTLLPPTIMAFLYFLIFGKTIGARVGQMNGYDYMDYIIPGIVLMTVINNSFNNVASSLFGSKFQRHIQELLVAPIPNYVILWGYVVGGVVRGWMTGTLVLAVALLFGHFPMEHWGLAVAVALITAILFSLAGFINGLLANDFDDISLMPIVMGPMIYLGGVFYSISILPPFWEILSSFNPILYMINAFRYGLLGISDVSITLSLFIMATLCIVLHQICLHMLNKGIGLKD